MGSRNKTSKKMDLDGFFRALRALMKEGRKRWRPERTERHIRIHGPRHRVRMAVGAPVYYPRYHCCPITSLCLALQIKTKGSSKTENTTDALKDGQKYLGLSSSLCYDIIVATDGRIDQLRRSRHKTIRRRLLQTLGLKKKKVA